jgi:hypothetical protein
MALWGTIIESCCSQAIQGLHSLLRAPAQQAYKVFQQAYKVAAGRHCLCANGWPAWSADFGQDHDPAQSLPTKQLPDQVLLLMSVGYAGQVQFKAGVKGTGVQQVKVLRHCRHSRDQCVPGMHSIPFVKGPLDDVHVSQHLQIIGYYSKM